MPFLLLDDAADQAKQRLEQFGQGLFQPLQPIGQSVQDITQGLQNFGQQQLQALQPLNRPPLQGRSVEDITQGLQDFGQVQLRNAQQAVRQVNQAQAQPPFAQTEPSVQPGGDLEDYARQAARKAGIDPDVFVRQMQQESGLQPTNPDGSPKTSSAGAVGVAQFMPSTARGLGVDPTDPYASLDAAAKLDAQNLRRYDGDWSRALAAYNAGPGAVDQYGDVPPFQETQSYVSNILGGAKQAVQTGAQNLAQTTGQTLGGVLPAISQFGDKELTAAEAYAACGPAAAVRFATLMGRQPTLREATDLAAQVGWTPQGGMAGLSSESALFDKMQIPHRMVGADWSALAREASSGNPVTISTPGHYFTADAYDPSSGAFHVGSSGTDLRGGSEWMTPQQMEARMGALQGGMAVDNPQVPGPSPLASAGESVQGGLTQLGQIKDRGLQVLNQAVGDAAGFMAPGGGLSDLALDNPLMRGIRAERDIGPAAASALQQPLGDLGQAIRNTPASPFIAPGRTAEGTPTLGDVLDAKAQVFPSILDPGHPMNQYQYLQDKYGGLDAPDMTPEDRKIADNVLLFIGGMAGPVTGGGELLPEARAAAAGVQRMFHGTGADFATVSPEAVSGENLYGPGYYLTSDPRVAGGVVRNADVVPQPGDVESAWGNLLNPATNPDLQRGAVVSPGYAQERGINDAVRRQLESQIEYDQYGLKLAQMVGDQERVARLQENIAYNQARLDKASAGPNVRAVDVPNDLNLLNVDAPVDPGLIDRARQLLGSRWDDAESFFNFRNRNQPPATNDQVLEILRDAAVPESAAAEGTLDINGPAARAAANRVLSDLGYDGITYSGGQRIPMMDAAGAPIEHQATVIFPESLNKITNAISGTQGGQANPMFAARLGGGALGGLAGYATAPEDATQQERLERAGLGAAAGLALPYAPGAIRAAIRTPPLDLLRATRIGSLAGGIPTLGHIALNAPIQAGLKLLSDVPTSVMTGHPEAIPAELYGAIQGIRSWAMHAGMTIRQPGPLATQLGGGTDAQALELGLTGLVRAHPVLQDLANQLAQHMELWRTAANAATDAGLTRLSPAWQAEVQRLVSAPTPRMQTAMARAGELAALRGPMGTTGAAISHALTSAPVLRLAEPIFNIGYQVATQGIERSPMGVLGTGWDVARGLTGAGPYGGVTGFAGTGARGAVTPLAQRVRNNVIGLGLALAGYLAASQKDTNGLPLITGEGPADPQAQQDLRDLGWQADSTLIDGRYVNNHLFGPAGWGLTAGANAYEAHNALDKQGNPLNLQGVLTDLAGREGRYFTNETFLRGVGSVLNFAGSSAQQSSTAGREAASFLESLIPQGALAANLAAVQDPYARQTQPGDILQAIQSRIPPNPLVPSREQLPARLTGTGQPVANPQQGWGLLAPRSTPLNLDPVLLAYARAGNTVSGPPKTLSLGRGREIEMTPDEQRTYQVAKGQMLSSLAGTMVSDPKFQNLPASVRNQHLQAVEQRADQYAQKMTLASIPSADIVSRMSYSRGPLAPAREGFLPPIDVAEPATP